MLSCMSRGHSSFLVLAHPCRPARESRFVCARRGGGHHKEKQAGSGDGCQKAAFFCWCLGGLHGKPAVRLLWEMGF